MQPWDVARLALLALLTAAIIATGVVFTISILLERRLIRRVELLDNEVRVIRERLVKARMWP